MIETILFLLTVGGVLRWMIKESGKGNDDDDRLSYRSRRRHSTFDTYSGLGNEEPDHNIDEILRHLRQRYETPRFEFSTSYAPSSRRRPTPRLLRFDKETGEWEGY